MKRRVFSTHLTNLMFPFDKRFTKVRPLLGSILRIVATDIYFVDNIVIRPYDRGNCWTVENHLIHIAAGQTKGTTLDRHQADGHATRRITGDHILCN